MIELALRPPVGGSAVASEPAVAGEGSATGEALDASVGFAGDTFNAAVYLKRVAGAGTEVAYVSVVGRDALSERMLARFVEEGLDVGLVARHPERLPGLYAIATDADGERGFSYWRERSAARTLFAPQSGLAPEALGEFDLVFLSAITLAILPPSVRERLLGWLETYRARGGRVAFDSNYRPRLWEDERTARETIGLAWERCDVALPSAEDERALFGDADARAVRARLRALGIVDGAVKDGARGALPMAEEADPGPLPEASRVIDTTAAGDAFDGAFLAARLAGADAAAAVRAGHRCASIVVGERGAIVPRERFDVELVASLYSRDEAH